MIYRRKLVLDEEVEAAAPVDLGRVIPGAVRLTFTVDEDTGPSWSVTGQGQTLTQAAADLEREIERMCGCWMSDQWDWFAAMTALSNGEGTFHHYDMGEDAGYRITIQSVDT